MPNCIEKINILQSIHPNQQQKSMDMIKSLVIQEESNLSFHAKLHGKDQYFIDYPFKPSAKINENDQILVIQDVKLIEIIKIIQLLE